MTNSEHDDEHDATGERHSTGEHDTAGETAAGLLMLRVDGPEQRAIDRLRAILDAHGLRCGPMVGPVISVTGPTDRVQALADHVEVALAGERPFAADPVLLDALTGVVDSFAWDEGAELT